jgi:hypothetical protein
MARLSCTLLLVTLACLCLGASGLRARRAAEGEEVYDPSLVELKNGAYAWQCCRVCPQNHILEIDQMFGSTPPPVRRYDDPQPVASTFLEQAAALMDVGDEGNNCCNVCPTGLAANAAAQTHASIPKPLPGGGQSKRPVGYVAPLQNLKFSLSRVPLPPCCPYCREASMDEAFNLAVRQPKKMRPLPRRRPAVAKKPAVLRTSLLETEAEAEAEADMESESELESETTTSKREYTYTNPTPGHCCNRCLRAPNPTEVATAAGEDVWPEAKPKEEAADEGADAAAAEEAPAEETAEAPVPV